MDLIKIQLSELETFCNSTMFHLFSVKPISPLRMKSYIANPRANADDVVLYMYVENGELIAFRTVLSDCVGNISFGWCSGTWVDFRFRGYKLSMKLFNEVQKDWHNRLMFTNYAPATEHNYLNSNQFKLLKERSGLRFYFYPNFSEIYNERKSCLKPILPLLSTLIGRISSLKSYFCAPNVSKFTELLTPDQECVELLRHYPKTFFNRKEVELDWIFNFPWLTSEKYDKFSYPFSFSGIDYSLKTVKIFENNSFMGFFVYTIVNRRMKIICHFMGQGKINLLIDVIAYLAQKNKIAYLTILDSSLAEQFKMQISCFAFSKPFNSHIYSTFEVENTLNSTIFDGDGDNCFT